MYRLAQFTRIQVLKDDPPPRKVLPIPTNVVYQQGNLILPKVTKFPKMLYLSTSSGSRSVALLWEADTSLFLRIRSSSYDGQPDAVDMSSQRRYP